MNTGMRKGITPVVAVVLLLMMTVAAAGAAYTWFSQMQQRLQQQATTQLQTEIGVKDLQCHASGETIEIAIKNSGSNNLALGSVDMYVKDSTGHLNITVTDMDLSTSTACQGGSCGFSDPGGFGIFTVNVSSPSDQPGTGTASPSDAELYQGSFYTVELDFTRSDYSLNVGGCLAQ